MSFTLYTPEEAAAMIRIITPSEINRLIASREIEYTSLSRGKRALTEEQMGKLVEHLAVKPTERAAGRATERSVFGETQRSARTRQRTTSAHQ